MHVLFAGLTTIDVTQRVARVPNPNEKVVASSASLDVGGPAANAARTCAALGGSARLVTLLGTGALPDLARSLLGSAGVQVIDVADDDFLAVSTVLIDDDGGRAIASTNNSKREIRFPDADVLDRVSVLEVDGHLLELQIPLARTARQMGIDVVLDGGSWRPGLEALLPHVTHAICSADFAVSGGSGDLFLDLAGYRIPVVAQTHGAEEVEVIVGGTVRALDVPKANVVDTLGAGDVLHGAFAHYLARGLEPIPALQSAIRVATSSTEHAGALCWYGKVDFA